MAAQMRLWQESGAADAMAESGCRGVYALLGGDPAEVAGWLATATTTATATAATAATATADGSGSGSGWRRALALWLWYGTGPEESISDAMALYDAWWRGSGSGTGSGTNTGINTGSGSGINTGSGSGRGGPRARYAALHAAAAATATATAAATAGGEEIELGLDLCYHLIKLWVWLKIALDLFCLFLALC
jgi:hypothetical protein